MPLQINPTEFVLKSLTPRADLDAGLLQNPCAPSRSRREGASRCACYVNLINSVPWLWARPAGLCFEHIFCTERALGDLPAWTASCVPVLLVSEGISKKITGTHYLVPIVAVARLAETPSLESPRFVLVLDEVRDPGRGVPSVRPGGNDGSCPRLLDVSAVVDDADARGCSP